jgi:lipopolysaccharide export system protein LptC
MPDPDGRSPMSRTSTVHNLAEATTFADDDLSLRRRNAFGTAVRHSRRVNFLRKTLPIAGGTGLLFIILWTWLDPLRFASGLPIELGRISISGTKLKMDAPKLKGFSRDGRPYTVTAEEAAQDLTKPNVIELSKIVGQFDLGGRGNMVLNAKSGIYDGKTEQMKLFDGIDFHSTEGHSGQLSDAFIEPRKGHLVTENPVDLFFNEGSLRGNRMEVFEQGKLIVFEGGVTMVLRMKESIAKSPGAEATQ